MLQLTMNSTFLGGELERQISRLIIAVSFQQKFLPVHFVASLWCVFFFVFWGGGVAFVQAN